MTIQAQIWECYKQQAIIRGHGLKSINNRKISRWYRWVGGLCFDVGR